MLEDLDLSLDSAPKRGRPPSDRDVPYDYKRDAKLQLWHQNLSLWILANPDKTMKDAALVFKCTPQCLYLIKNSDAFKVFHAEQLSKLADKTIDAISDIYTKTAAMTEQALDHINQKLTDNGSVMDIELLHKIADGGLKRLGYGAPSAPPGPSVQVNIGAVVDRGVLEDARNRMNERFGKGGSPRPALELAASSDPPKPGGTPDGGGL